MEDWDLTDGEFEIVVMKKLNIMQEKLMNKKEYFTKEIETTKKEPNSGAEALNKWGKY